MHRNRLADALSPYLRQHGHNPVDWYPWSDDALGRARAEDRPILLSIGYSACHWCHVMERESFEDTETAAVMNELFVNVKVDREERPDLDHVYQTVVQIMGRSGGWPLTVFLTPALRPFYAGTYFPPADRHGMPAFRTVLRAVAEAYRTRRADIEKTAGDITDAITKVTAPRGEPGDVPPDAVSRAARALVRRFDDHHGGFGGAPKFPNTMPLDVLLRAAVAEHDDAMLGRVRLAIDAMRDGGIHDQLGGGFHRYSVDERWAVPHFEKMLYDNALIGRLLADAFRVTGDASYEATAAGIVEWAMREMCAPDGTFYSSQDADSEGEEGRFFAWTPEQVDAACGGADGEVARIFWGVAPGGNFEHGTTVLHRNRSLSTVARQLGRTEEDVASSLARAKKALFDAREARPRPFRDEKIIASWNGLMIGALAEMGMALGRADLVAAARDGLFALRARLWRDGALLRIGKDGAAHVPAFLEDHGDVACAALDVHDALLGEPGDDAARALGLARDLCDAALARFLDRERGGFFFAPEGSTDLLVRTKDAYDNAVPSGVSSTCHALLRLAAVTGEPRYADPAERAMRSLASDAVAHPFGFGHLVGAMHRLVSGGTEIAVVGPAGDPAVRALLDVARRAYVPDRVLVRLDPDAPAHPTLGARPMVDGRPTAYVCTARTCGAPIVDPEALRQALVRGTGSLGASPVVRS